MRIPVLLIAGLIALGPPRTRRGAFGGRGAPGRRDGSAAGNAPEAPPVPAPAVAPESAPATGSETQPAPAIASEPHPARRSHPRRHPRFRPRRCTQEASPVPAPARAPEAPPCRCRPGPASRPWRRRRARSGPIAGARGPHPRVPVDGLHDVELPVLIKFHERADEEELHLRRAGPGKITIISPRRVTMEEAYNVFLSVLQAKGSPPSRRGTRSRSSRPREARQDTIRTGVSKETPRRNSFTRLVPLQNLESAEVVPLITPLVSRTGWSPRSAPPTRCC